MPEKQIHLTLTSLQQRQYFAHLLVYLFGQAADVHRPRHKATNDLVHEVAYRVFHTDRHECQEHAFVLSEAEAQAVKDAFTHLHDRYAQRPELETSVCSLKDLATCRSLLEQAEQHSHTNTESWKYDG